MRRDGKGKEQKILQSIQHHTTIGIMTVFADVLV